jgi:hypothetical protein
MPMQPKRLCHGQRTPLIGFEANLLGEHDIAWNEGFIWHKTPTRFWMAVPVKFPDIGRCTVTYAVFFPALATGDVKIPVLAKLNQLLGREPFPQQLYASQFAFSATQLAIPLARRSRPARDICPKSDHANFGAAKQVLQHRELAANQTWEKQGLVGGRIELVRHGRLTGTSSNCRCEASAGQLFEASLCVEQRLRILCIKNMPCIAAVVHNDLGCHRNAPSIRAKSTKQCYNSTKVPKSERHHSIGKFGSRKKAV